MSSVLTLHGVDIYLDIKIAANMLFLESHEIFVLFFLSFLFTLVKKEGNTKIIF